MEHLRFQTEIAERQNCGIMSLKRNSNKKYIWNKYLQAINDENYEYKKYRTYL